MSLQQTVAAPSSHGWDAAKVLELANPVKEGKWTCPAVTGSGARCKLARDSRLRDAAKYISDKMSLQDPARLRDDAEQLVEMANLLLCTKNHFDGRAQLDEKESTSSLDLVVAAWRNKIDRVVRGREERREQVMIAAAVLDPGGPIRQPAREVETISRTPESSLGSRACSASTLVTARARARQQISRGRVRRQAPATSLSYTDALPTPKDFPDGNPRRQPVKGEDSELLRPRAEDEGRKAEYERVAAENDRLKVENAALRDTGRELEQRAIRAEGETEELERVIDDRNDELEELGNEINELNDRLEQGSSLRSSK